MLNDVGPELVSAGSQRIQSYLGKMPPLATWDDAVTYIKATFGELYPDFTRLVGASSPRTRSSKTPGGSRASLLRSEGRRSDASCCRTERCRRCGTRMRRLRSIPTLAIRGELSDLLSLRCLRAHEAQETDLLQVTVANRGHAPLLHEPACQDAIDAFLASISDYAHNCWRGNAGRTITRAHC